MSHLHHKVSALVDGEMSGATRRRALSHLDRCAACRAEVASVLSVKRALRGLAAVEPSDDLARELTDLDDARCRPASAARRRRPVLGRSLVGAGAATGVVLATAYAIGGTEPARQVQPDVDEAVLGYASVVGGSGLSDQTPTQTGAAVPLVPLRVQRPDRRAGPGRQHRGGAVRWLRRAVAAPTHYAFAGVRQVNLWDVGARARVDIDHVPEEGTTVAVPGSGEATATFVSSAGGSVESSWDERSLRTLLRAYDVSVAGPCHVAGRACTVVQATDGPHLVARFLIDNRTGVLLAREQYHGGTLQRSSRFTTVHVTRDGFLSHVPPVLGDRAATRLSASHTGTLSDEGWSCPSRLGDFDLVQVDVVDGSAGGEATRFVYSDGVATATVTEERGALDPSRLSGFTRVGGLDDATPPVWVRRGLPDVMVWGESDVVYTMVTSAPPQVSMGLVHGLDAHTASPDSPGRLQRGLQRMGAAMLPG